MVGEGSIAVSRRSEAVTSEAKGSAEHSLPAGASIKERAIGRILSKDQTIPKSLKKGKGRGDLAAVKVNIIVIIDLPLMESRLQR